ncbi:hypothetical protein L249_6432 [Ophiocordyceps polyrhachis-furcata BCC 54312]|nr:hypothetical protein L249_6432 [Ophiocordyceps polyrhachis-furcata BCC 54312]
MHERLAHAGKEKVIQACRKAGIVIEKSTAKGFLCKACQFAKADTIISRDSLARPTRFLDIVFWDMIEHNPPGYSGARYSLHGINAFTRFHWIISAITKGLYGIRYEAKRKDRKIREDSSSSLEGPPLIRARDIRFVNRARLSAIIEDPSIEFKARFNPLVCVDRITALKASLIRRDLGHGAYKTLEEIRPSQFSCIESCEEIERLDLELCLYRYADSSLLVLYIDNILLAAPIKAQINEKAAILNALYEVKHLEFLRLEFKRNRKAKTIRVY